MNGLNSSELIMGLLASAPILLLVIVLACSKKSSTLKASVCAILLTIVLALFGWKMPASNILMASIEGAIMAIWPISVVVIAAVFLYNICNETGYIATIQQGITALSSDKQIIVLLVVWGFGSFIEGIAGFGTSIAVSATMLYSLGFPPFLAALLAIVANPISSVFGSLGVQMPTIANITDLSPESLAINSTCAVIPLIICTPFILIFLTKKGLDLKQSSTKACVLSLFSGIAFAAAMYFVAKYISSDLAGVVGALIAILVLIVGNWLITRNDHKTSIDAKKQLIAWSPFIICLILLLVTSRINGTLYSQFSVATFSVHIPIGESVSIQNINILNNATIWIFIAGIIGGLIQKASFKTIACVFVATVKQMFKIVLTLVLLMAISRIMSHSGMIDSLANLVVSLLGFYYIATIPFLGSVGAFITGSATSANVLLGELQVTIANTLSFDPSKFMGLSIVGGTIGKMISPQNIAIGLAGVSLTDQANKMFLSLIKWYFLYLFIMTITSVIMLIYA